MYELPTLTGVSRCIVEKDAIMGDSDVLLVTENAEPVPLPSIERKSA
jgi:hypothetical protein